MKIIFPQDPVVAEAPDPAFLDEVAAATHSGIDLNLIDYEALIQQGNAARAVRAIPVYDEKELAIYRGWGLTVAQYTMLYDALFSRGLRLIHAPDVYRRCQYLPEQLPIFEDRTPRTVWMKSSAGVSNDAIMALLLPFAGQPVIVRDFVRTQKHYWTDACYIESSSDPSAVREVVQRFLELQGNAFEGGLVFRAYRPLESLTTEHGGGMPLALEYRLVYLDGQHLMTLRYWNMPGAEQAPQPPVEEFASIAARLPGRFTALDVARTAGGGAWIILEAGDGQVMPMPGGSAYEKLYNALAALKS